MVVYTDQMFNRGTADTSLTQMASGVSSTQGTYFPQLNGVLKRVDIFVTPQAATRSCISCASNKLICSQRVASSTSGLLNLKLPSLLWCGRDLSGHVRKSLGLRWPTTF